MPPLAYAVEPLHPLHGANHDIQHIAELYSEGAYSPGEPRPVVPAREVRPERVLWWSVA
jgi:hypothetical protein